MKALKAPGPSGNRKELIKEVGEGRRTGRFKGEKKQITRKGGGGRPVKWRKVGDSNSGESRKKKENCRQ